MIKLEDRIKNCIWNIDKIEESIELEFKMREEDWSRISKLIDLKQECFEELGRMIWIRESCK